MATKFEVDFINSNRCFSVGRGKFEVPFWPIFHLPHLRNFVRSRFPLTDSGVDYFLDVLFSLEEEEEVIRILKNMLARGFPIDARGSYSKTLLSLSALYYPDRTKIPCYLLSKGANPENLPPRHWSKKSAYEAYIRAMGPEVLAKTLDATKSHSSVLGKLVCHEYVHALMFALKYLGIHVEDADGALYLAKECLAGSFSFFKSWRDTLRRTWIIGCVRVSMGISARHRQRRRPAMGCAIM